MANGTHFGVIFPGQVGSNFMTFIARQSGPVSASILADGAGVFQVSSMQSYRRAWVVVGGGGGNAQIRRPQAPLASSGPQGVTTERDWVPDELGTTSLAHVAAGEMVEVVVDFHAPTVFDRPDFQVNDVYTATLSVNGPQSQRPTFALTAERGGISVEAVPAQLTIEAGGQATVNLTLVSLCGRDTVVSFQSQWSQPGVGSTFAAPTVILPRARVAYMTLQIVTSVDATMGGHGLTWPVTAFDGELTVYLEIGVTVVASPARAWVWSSLPPSLSLDGSLNSFVLICQVSGHGTQFEITPFSLPDGVTLHAKGPLKATVADKGSAEIEFSLAVASRAAPGFAGALTLNWIAFNGQVDGVLTTYVTLLPLPTSIGLACQFQQTAHWCWIAVATSVDHFFNPASTQTQCQIMDKVMLQHPSPSRPPGTSACPTDAGLAAAPDLAPLLANPYAPESQNVLDDARLGILPGYTQQTGGVKDSLAVSGNANGDWISAMMPLPQIRAEMAAGQPIAIDLEWPDTGQHAVAIAGVLGGILFICDPINGESLIDYAAFPGSYQGGATFVGACLTKRSS